MRHTTGRPRAAGPLAIAAAGLALLTACSFEGGSPSTGDTGTTGDDTAGDTAALDTPPDTAGDTVTTDTATTDTSDDTGDDTEGSGAGFGEACGQNRDCSSRLCLTLAADTGFCSEYCEDSTDCPGNADCTLLSTGSEATRACVSSTLCLDDDGDGYGVGPGCAAADCDDANAALSPAADEVCDGLDNDCDGATDERPVDANLPCDTGFSGICATGRQVCDSGLVTCEPDLSPRPELCDNVDNDCDGSSDESDTGAALQSTCYGGPSATLGVGACRAGTRVCTGGVEGDCEGQVLPFPELCDGLDNDCDGTADEGNPGAGLACTTGQQGVCGVGVTSCGDGAPACLPSLAPSAEVCDGLDNDCDGATDEDDAGNPLVTDCYDGPEGTLGVGACKAGTRTCVAGQFGSCGNDVEPSDERCDGIDNNCDGLVDEGEPGAGFACPTGEPGVCATGLTVCASGELACRRSFEPSPDVCDGLDNDCDGLFDEADSGDPLTRTCYDGPGGSSGVGQCRSGEQICVFGDWGNCVGQVVPTAEVCDTIDNNCNGSVDEGVTVTYWADTDDDNYGDPAAPIQACFRPTGYANNDDDCYDGNAEANPRQRGFFATQRGDGSFDYNCDGNPEREFTTRGSCDTSQFLCGLNAGWEGSVPACGASASFIYECRGVLVLCSASTRSQPQACR